MKNFLGFLIVPILLFNYFSLTSSASAAGVTTSANINYSFLNNTFKVDIPITLKNTSNSTSIVNYYTILLPYQGIKDLKVDMGKRVLGVTQYKQKDGVELIINFKSLVLEGKDSKSFKISFESTNLIDSEWGYGKVISQISGLTVKKVVLEYESNKPGIFKADGAKINQISGSNKKYEFTNITNPQISINFGSPTTLSYEFQKLYINDSDDVVVNEVALPYTDQTQQFILTSISPTPVSKRIDTDGNLLVGFLVEKADQEQVLIKGFIIKNKLSFEQKYLDTDLDTLGFWDITNQFELIRLENYLKSHNLTFTAQNASKYVVSRLKPQASSAIVGATSFENALRGGADVAIGRKDYAVAEDYVDLLIGILREKSIPSKMTVGFLPESHPLLSTSSFHSWVEYYDLKEKEWSSLDPSIQDIHKVANYDANVVNSVKLITRSSNPNQPKLPYLNAKDLKIKPIGNTTETVFDVTQSGNTLTNNGNIPVKISDSTTVDVLLPDESKDISRPGEVTVLTLYGEKKNFKIENSSVLPEDSTSILSELIVFMTFLAILLGANTLYVKLKKR